MFACFQSFIRQVTKPPKQCPWAPTHSTTPICKMFPLKCRSVIKGNNVKTGIRTKVTSVSIRIKAKCPLYAARYANIPSVLFWNLEELSFFEEKESGHKVRSDKQQQLRSHLWAEYTVWEAKQRGLPLQRELSPQLKDWMEWYKPDTLTKMVLGNQ